VVRQRVPFMEDDRPMVWDIEAITGLVRSGAILDAVESAVGEIQL
jgi:histidine ammonia-lyase